jgi:site-specific recombinase XerD
MLNQYRRHTKKCTKGYQQHDRKQNNCKCIVYVEGKLNKSSDYIKQSTGTRSWEEARKMIVAAEQRGYWSASAELGVSCHCEAQSGQQLGKSINDAVDAFLSEASSDKGRNLAPATFSKYRTVLGRLKKFTTERGIIWLDEVQLSDLLVFKQTWSTGPRATVNNIQRLRGFFHFCVSLGWIEESPAQGLKMPKGIKSTQKMPFSEGEMLRILQTAQTISLHERQAISNLDLYAFILTMRYTGLRISDTGLLTSGRLDGDSIFLYARKNGALVYCPLLPWVANVLRTVSVKSGGYLFCTGSTRLETVVELWSKRLKQVFQAAGIKNGTSHRFRHTFAVDLLQNGADIKNVSMLLGHESVLTTEEHYSAWIQSRQNAFNADVLRAYEQGQKRIHLVGA